MESISILKKQRIEWIDWVKTIAIFLIIAGHCNVPGSNFIYVFSVPCFFILSGFLSKKEDSSVFWKKTWWNLILPMFLFVILTLILHTLVQFFVGRFELISLIKNICRAICGFVSEGLWRLWFVYTLVLCKIVYQYLPPKTIVLIIVNVVLLYLSTIVHTTGENANAILNVCLAMPFFTIGTFFRPLKQNLTKVPWSLLVLLIIAGAGIVFICGRYNELVMLYRCYAGSNIPLCLIGGLAGTVVIYALSVIVRSFAHMFANVVGGGTIVILATHYELMTVIGRFVSFQGFYLYIEALVLLLLCIPLILLIKRYVPILYGRYRV